jgi:pilus assembly protein Flp/PilA
MGVHPVLSNIAKELVDDTSGATAIEYGLILALIAIAIIAAVQNVAGTTITMWNNVSTRSSSAMNGA